MYFTIYKPIPPQYNLVLPMLWRHPESVDLNRVKAVHYCAAGSKPWRYTGKEENMGREDVKELVCKWRVIYNDPSLNSKAQEHELVGESPRIPKRFGKMLQGLDHLKPAPPAA